MHAEIRHQKNMAFETRIRNHTFALDTQVASGGDNTGPSPKEMLVASVIGCTGMDVVELLKKHKMTAESLTISADAEPRKEHPRIFTSMTITFQVTGSQVGAKELTEAVHLSLTKFCGVTAMISKVVRVEYDVVLNQTSIGKGVADFGL